MGTVDREMPMPPKVDENTSAARVLLLDTAYQFELDAYSMLGRSEQQIVESRQAAQRAEILYAQAAVYKDAAAQLT